MRPRLLAAALLSTIALSGCGADSGTLQRRGPIQRVQQASATTPEGATSLSLDWPNPTTEGNFLVLTAHVSWDSTIGEIGVPAGWTLVDRADSHGFRQVSVALYFHENAPSQSGAIVVTALNSEDRIKMVIAEYSGLARTSSLDQFAQSVGLGVSPTSGTTPPTAEARELWLGAIATDVPFQCNPTNDFIQVALSSSGASGLGLYGRFAETIGPAGVSITAKSNCDDVGDPELSTDWAGVVATFHQ